MRRERKSLWAVILCVLVVLLVALSLLWIDASDPGAAAPTRPPEVVAAGSSAILDPLPDEGERPAPESELEVPAPELEPEPTAPSQEAPSLARGDRGRGPGAFELELRFVAVDADDHPLAGADVLFAPVRHRLNVVGITDQDGRFTFEWNAHVPEMEVVFALRGRSDTWSGLRVFRAATGVPTELRVALPGERNFAKQESTRSAYWLREELMRERYLEDARGDVPPSLSRVPFLGSEGGRPLFVARASASGGGGPQHDAFQRQWRELAQFQSDLARFQKRTPILVPAAPGSGARLSGTVTDAFGRPAEGALVVLSDDPEHEGRIGVHTDAAGHYEIPDIEPGTWNARAGGGEFGRGTHFGSLFLREVRSWDFVLDRGVELAGVVFDSRSRPLEGWSLELEGHGSEMLWNDFAHAGEDGGFSVANVGEDLEGSALSLHVRPRGDTADLPLATFDVADPLVWRDIVIDEQELAPLVLSGLGRLEDDDVVVRVWQEASDRGRFVELGTESTHVVVAPGSYVVELGSAMQGWSERRVFLEPLEPLLFTPRLPRGGLVEWIDTATPRSREDVDDAMKKRRGLRYQLLELREDVNSLVAAFTGHPREPMRLPAGVYELVAFEDELPIERVAFTVEDGRDVGVLVPTRR